MRVQRCQQPVPRADRERRRCRAQDQLLRSLLYYAWVRAVGDQLRRGRTGASNVLAQIKEGFAVGQPQKSDRGG